MQIDERLRLVAHGDLGVAVILPDGDDDKGEHHRVEDADHGKFETGDLVVEAQAVAAPAPAARRQHQAGAVELGDGDHENRQQPRVDLVQLPEHEAAVRNLRASAETEVVALAKSNGFAGCRRPW